MATIVSTTSPVQLAIYNYPSVKPELSAIRELVLDRLTITGSTIDAELLNILDGLKCKQIIVTGCKMKSIAKEILGHSAQEKTSFDHCQIVTSFKLPRKSKELHDFGFRRLGDEFIPFQPSLHHLAQKHSLLFGQSLEQVIDKTMIQKKTAILNNDQNDLKTLFIKTYSIAQRVILQFNLRMKIEVEERDILFIPLFRRSLAQNMALKASAMTTKVRQISYQVGQTQKPDFQFDAFFIEKFEHTIDQLITLIGEYDVIRNHLIHIHLQIERSEG